MPVPLPNFVRRHAQRTGCNAAVHQAAIRQTLFFVLERDTSPSARRPMPTPSPHTRSLPFSASNGGVDEYSSGLACLVFLRNTISRAVSANHVSILKTVQSSLGSKPVGGVVRGFAPDSRWRSLPTESLEKCGMCRVFSVCGIYIGEEE